MEEHCVELDYSALEKEAADTLALGGVWILATSAGDRVTARSMSIIANGLDVWFQTSDGSTKIEQIKANARVALCKGNAQYEGIAEIRGSCGEPRNAWFLENYSLAHSGSFKAYGTLPEELVVSLRPIRVIFWKYIDDRPFRDILDVEAGRARRVRQRTVDDGAVSGISPSVRH